MTTKLTLSNGMEFLRVPAGKFIMGSNDGNDDEKPQHILDIPYDYWMARFPVTNELYNAYTKATGINNPLANWKKKLDHPVVCITWDHATAYCKWLNDFLKAELPSNLVLRLPTEAEWEKAARGNDGYIYPWGNTFDKNKCNTSEGRTGDTTPVDFYSPQGDSHYGCADMAGNVWEMTHSLYRKYPYKMNDDREDEIYHQSDSSVSEIENQLQDIFASLDLPEIPSRVNRGGCYDYPNYSARNALRMDASSVEGDVRSGFRVCASLPISHLKSG